MNQAPTQNARDLATLALTSDSLALFLAYAKDAANWSGTPLVGGNVDNDPADARRHRGNITQLKQAGLVTTFAEGRCVFIHFTKDGIAFARMHGTEIES